MRRAFNPRVGGPVPPGSTTKAETFRFCLFYMVYMYLNPGH